MNKDSKVVLENLDLSGGPNSWFDMWHTHMDWHGDGNKNWELRKKYIAELIEFYDEVKLRIINSQIRYQLWIRIFETDSAEDAVFVHSPNPNEKNFPLIVKSIENLKPRNQRLKDFLDGLGFEIVAFKYAGKLQYFLFDKTIGVPLAKE